ncbi:MAG TPA: TonB-dependent receptor [Bryobacteraceae bacterium]|nr:TonB-dependent receptor [Bryobacteraceae bacterium]
MTRLPLLLLFLSAPAFPQATATLRGEVVDPAGQAIAAAQITLENQLSGFERTALSDAAGLFNIANIPFQTYLLRVEKTGFAASPQSLQLRTNVPQTVRVNLELAGQVTRLEITAGNIGTLLDAESSGTRTAMNAAEMSRMPVPPGSRGLESVLVSFPGFALNANGAIHPRGAHNQMTYVIDGMAISDQLTGAFANAVDPSIVQTIELFTGNIPAEFGSKISGVAVITTKSGLGGGRRFSGSSQVSAAQYETLSQVTQVSGGSARLGYFASLNTLKSNHYLDQVSTSNLHNGGNSERAFVRLDYQPSPVDQLRLNAMAGRSGFELANLRSQQLARQDQRQLLRDASLSLAWLRVLGPRTTIDASFSYRTSIAQLFPSAGDTPVTAAQGRHLTTLAGGARWNRQSGRHVLRGGFDSQYFPVSENFSFAVTDPAFNQPGSAAYIPTLLAHDISRGGAPFYFSARRSGSLHTAFAQDSIKLAGLTLSLGLRYDRYRFLTYGNQMQPRVGLAYHLKRTGTVFRASYNRTYQTPPNENLLLSSSDESSVLVPASVRQTLGGAHLLIHPERQNVYEVGLQQAAGSLVSLNLAYYHKDSRDLQDNDNFFNTGIIFPTSLKQSRTNGAELRLAVLPWRRLSGSLSLTHFHTIVTPPFTGGLFLGSTAVDALNAGPFVIDHDQTLSAHAILQYAVRRHLWISNSIRYDSGLVSNPSDPAVVAADPDYSDLLPYVNLTADLPRVRPRTIVDFALGYDRVRRDRRVWDAVFQISNVTNRTALYNFQSIFVGTRLVQPRTASLKLRFYF